MRPETLQRVADELDLQMFRLDERLRKFAEEIETASATAIVRAAAELSKARITVRSYMAPERRAETE